MSGMGWEYFLARIQMPDGPDAIEQWQGYFTDRGKDGWELVSMTGKQLGPAAGGKPGITEYTLVFKRPVSDAFRGSS
jgi:hypothetical protein